MTAQAEQRQEAEAVRFGDPDPGLQGAEAQGRASRRRASLAAVPSPAAPELPPASATERDRTRVAGMVSRAGAGVRSLHAGEHLTWHPKSLTAALEHHSAAARRLEAVHWSLGSARMTWGLFALLVTALVLHPLHFLLEHPAAFLAVALVGVLIRFLMF